MSMCKDAATATITNVVQKVVFVQSALYILPDTWVAPSLLILCQCVLTQQNTIFVLYLQSAKIKKGSRGDINVLRPTLMAVVPVSQEPLSSSGIFHTARRPANTRFDDYSEETEELLFPRRSWIVSSKM